MTWTLELDEEERALILSGLRSSHTHTLDALGECITQGSVPAAMLCLGARARILRMASKLGQTMVDDFRMGHLREHAERKGVELPWPVS